MREFIDFIRNFSKLHSNAEFKTEFLLRLGRQCYPANDFGALIEPYTGPRLSLKTNGSKVYGELSGVKYDLSSLGPIYYCELQDQFIVMFAFPTWNVQIVDFDVTQLGFELAELGQLMFDCHCSGAYDLLSPQVGNALAKLQHLIDVITCLQCSLDDFWKLIECYRKSALVRMLNVSGYDGLDVSEFLPLTFKVDLPSLQESTEKITDSIGNKFAMEDFVLDRFGNYYSTDDPVDTAPMFKHLVREHLEPVDRFLRLVVAMQ